MNETIMKPNEEVIILARDFSPYPAGRYRRDGPFSGEAFLEDTLMPVLAKRGRAVVNIDGVAGLPSSFWEEVFGGLVRRHHMTPESIRQSVRITTSDKSLEPFTRLAYRFAEDAARQ